MIDRTPPGHTGETVAYLAGEGWTIRRPTKAEAIREAESDWPEYVRGELAHGPVHWIEIVDAGTFDREQAEERAR